MIKGKKALLTTEFGMEIKEEARTKKNAKAAPPTITPLLHTIPETQKLLGGLSRTFVYELLGSGQLKSVKIGKRRLVPHDEIVRLVELLRAVA